MDKKAFLLCLILTVAILSGPAWPSDYWDLDLGLNLGACGGVGIPTVPSTFDFGFTDAVWGLDGSLQYRLTPVYFDVKTQKVYEPPSKEFLGLGIGYLWAVSDLKYPVLSEPGWSYPSSNWTTSYVPAALFFKGVQRGKYIQFGLVYYAFHASVAQDANQFDPNGVILVETKKVHAKSWGDGWGFSLTLGAEQTEPSRVRAGFALTGRLTFPREHGHSAPVAVSWSQSVPANLTGLTLSLRFKPSFF